MAHRMSRVAVLGLFFCAGLLHAQFLKIPGFGAKANTAAGLSDATIGSGLKEALSVGTQKAVDRDLRRTTLADVVAKIRSRSR